jgi:hypothetical protein
MPRRWRADDWRVEMDSAPAPARDEFGGVVNPAQRPELASGCHVLETNELLRS